MRATTSKLAAFHLRKDASESPKARKKLKDKQEDQPVVQADVQIGQEITENLHKGKEFWKNSIYLNEKKNTLI